MRTAVTAFALLALVACGGGEDPSQQATDRGPAPLELTPGSWAANAERASFADESGNVLATMRCDAEAAELMLETPGAFAEGARQAMLVRVGEFMHGIENVEVREDDGGPVKVARLPVAGPLSDSLLAATVPMTIETDGAPAVMLETDEQLQGFIEQCRTEAGTAAPAAEGEPAAETPAEG